MAEGLRAPSVLLLLRLARPTFKPPIVKSCPAAALASVTLMAMLLKLAMSLFEV